MLGFAKGNLRVYKGGYYGFWLRCIGRITANRFRNIRRIRAILGQCMNSFSEVF